MENAASFILFILSFKPLFSMVFGNLANKNFSNGTGFIGKSLKISKILNRSSATSEKNL